MCFLSPKLCLIPPFPSSPLCFSLSLSLLSTTPLSLLFLSPFFLIITHFLFFSMGQNQGDLLVLGWKQQPYKKFKSCWIMKGRKERKHNNRFVLFLFFKHQNFYHLYNLNISICRDLHINIFL